MKQLKLVEDASIYQLSLRLFTPEGTLRAAEKMLPMLADLGPKYLQLVAITAADDDGDQTYWSKRQIASGTNNPKNSYRMKDYFHVDDEYGTDEDFKRFVAAAHKNGLRIILDLVYLHCGPKAAFLNEHPEYVQRNPDGTFKIMGEWAFPRFDYSNMEVREYLWSNMLYWVKEFDVDGFRCDVGDAIPVDFWVEGVKRVRAIKEDVIMVNEGRGNEYFAAFDVNYFYEGSFDAVPVAKGEMTAAAFRKKWEDYRLTMPENGRILHYIDNHDVTSDNGEDRIEKVIGTNGVDALLVLDFMLDGVPFVFNGYEVADELKHSMFSNRFFGKDPAINWANIFCEKGQKRYALLKKLYHLRSEHQALKTAKLNWLENTAPDQVISFCRPTDEKSLFVLVNMTKEPVVFEVEDVPEMTRLMQPILQSNTNWVYEDGKMKVQMLGFGYLAAEY